MNATVLPTPLLDPPDAPCVVLDTNTLLDWLVFADPAVGPLVAAIQSRQVLWISSAPVRAELHHVLSRGVAAAWQPDARRIDDAHARHAFEVAQPAAHAAEPGLRCTDADDQKFVDLALAHRARWLITRDRAVLKLARKAAGRGLVITTPARWSLTP